jgi:thiol:disulfide interchange protein DsbC
MEGLMQNYKSENQCPDGRKKVEETIEFMKRKGIQGTPAYIFPDGTRQMGVLDANVIMRRLSEADQPKEKARETPKSAPKKN